MQIHTRLAWLTFIVTLVALGGATLLWNASLRRETSKELNARLLDQARVVEALLPSPGDPALVSEADRLARLLSLETGSRITVILADGKVIADSSLPPEDVPGMENHGDRPEVRAALSQGTGQGMRWSATLSTRMAYLAVRWGPHDRPHGVVRAALPMTRVVEEQTRGRSRLFMVVLAALGFAAVLGYVASKRISRPLTEISAGARAIGGGDLDRRLELKGPREVQDLAMAVNHLAGSVQAEILEVDAERRRLAGLLESMPDGILVLDGRGRITLMNDAARAMFEPELDPIGRIPVEALRNKDLQEAADRTFEEGTTVTVEINVVHPERRVLLVSLVPLSPGLVSVMRDITRLRRLQEARREMVSNIGHELRTPLSAVMGYLETLLHDDGLSEEDRRRFLEITSRNASRLERLVRDLSRLSRLESSKIAVSRVPVDAAELVGEVAETLSPRARNKGVEIVTRLEPGMPPLLGERHELETVLLNLLDNAIRVSPERSPVRIEAGLEDSMIRFRVRDRGPGIPADLRERVFERFYRMDSGRSAEEGGSGLGLAIAKHAVQLHGGEIHIEDPPPGEPGVVFTFTIPVSVPAPA